ncbi:hypothetical protein CN514_00930 [Bacillus sp. AFS001701]|uniref:phage head-tail connector protein n=1 Tax=Bacillus sp. AFS001701 TaxID=2033480 RepID=UPI000BF8DF4C|nr:phage head-tail connector protein [Bacillus sp. AFS001701]PET77591.1 hypothetical protein CN514_00930 [Bacillus sp. AFS001701]
MPISEVKTLIGISDNSRDNELNIIINNAASLVREYLGLSTVPASLNWIVDEISITRFNRLHSEGISQEKIDTVTTTYSGNLLDPYKETLDKYLENNATESKQGRLRML